MFLRKTEFGLCAYQNVTNNINIIEYIEYIEKLRENLLVSFELIFKLVCQEAIDNENSFYFLLLLIFRFSKIISHNFERLNWRTNKINLVCVEDKFSLFFKILNTKKIILQNIIVAYQLVDLLSWDKIKYY